MEVHRSDKPNFRKLLEDNFFCVRHKVQVSLSQIPEAEELIKKAYSLKQAEFAYKRSLLNEFLSECTFQNSELFQFNSSKKNSLVTAPVSNLQEKNWILSVSSITDGFLSCLEPFPFDREEILKKEQTGKINLNFIRNNIEKQYLAWKYQVHITDINEIFYRFTRCFYSGRSFKSLKKNISLLETVPHIQGQNVAKKIYLLYQKPFNIENVYNFQDNVAGLVWHVFPHHCPKVLSFSHQYLLFIVSVFEMLNFTEKQIQMGLAFINSNFIIFINRLNNLLENPKLEKYRNEAEFLKLLYFNSKDLSYLVKSRSYENLLEFIRLFGMKHRGRCVTKSSLKYLISQIYNTHYNLLEPFSHSHFKLVPEMQIHETLTFLKETGFTIQEIVGSIDVIFYPRELIEKTFEEINENEALKEIRDCDSETVFFRNGVKGKTKVLQLCLYLMEKPYDFSGEGVWFAK